MLRKNCLAKLFVLGTAFAAAAACGRDLYVATNALSVYPYTSWPNAASNIEWAVNAATNGDTVWVSNGVYVLTNQVTVMSNITIQGLSTNARPIVYGNYGFRCFSFVTNTTGTMANLFITGGYTNGGNGGGALLHYGTVLDCVFSNNTATNANGGGLNIISGLVQRCTFIKNYSSAGGGLYYNGGTRVDHCMFWTNTSKGNGGGLMAYVGIGMVTGCTFMFNVSGNWGGGIYNYQSVITDCTLISNRAAEYGGGIYVYLSASGSQPVSNCYIYGNLALVHGGGIRDGAAQNCRIVSNTANHNGGGLAFTCDRGQSLFADNIIEGNIVGLSGGEGKGGGVYVGGAEAFKPTFRNCLIRNNSGKIGGGVFLAPNRSIFSGCTIVSNYSSGASGAGGVYGTAGNITSMFDNCIIYFNTSANVSSNYDVAATNFVSFTNCCFSPALTSAVPASISTNNITVDPLFSDRLSGDYHLDVNSPCINAGVNRPWMTDAADLEGQKRIFYGVVDIGAYERIFGGTIYNCR